MKVYDGAGMVADKGGAVLVPIRIDGLTDTRLSRLRGRIRQRWFPRLTLTVANTPGSQTLIWIIVGCAAGAIVIIALAVWLICKKCCRSTSDLRYMRSQQSTMFSGPSTMPGPGTAPYGLQPMVSSQASFSIQDTDHLDLSHLR